jgi:dihydroneopterin aldolase
MTKEKGVDQLILSGLEAWVKVGCSEEERAFPQRIEMDVTLHLPLGRCRMGRQHGRHGRLRRRLRPH